MHLGMWIKHIVQDIEYNQYFSLSLSFFPHFKIYRNTVCLNKLGSYCVLWNLVSGHINLVPSDNYDNFPMATEELILFNWDFVSHFR